MDNWIIAQFDRVGIWAQRHGYRLTEIHVHCAGFTLAAQLGRAAYGQEWIWAFILLLAWAPHFVICLHRAKQYGDYFERVAALNHLNALALMQREETILKIIRVAILCMILFGMPFMVLKILNGAWGDALRSALSDFSIFLVVYTLCCTFIGPGEFGKKKHEVTTGKEIFGQGS